MTRRPLVCSACDGYVRLECTHGKSDNKLFLKPIYCALVLSGASQSSYWGAYEIDAKGILYTNEIVKRHDKDMA